MVAHFDFEDGCDTKQLCYRLNRMMPPDICIYKIEQVADDMHARFSATSRTYHYYISTKRNPFNRQYTWLCHYDLDFELMNQAAEILMEYKDFASFCKSHTDVKTTLCNIIEAKWIKDDEGCYYFRIKANRFLRNMVRAVVGTLVEIGRHRLSLDDFRNVIEGKKRTMAGESMPANALFLEKIEY
jgi:tRNA pseudouridine38-40 synthase